jgi:hypothetical protein
MISTYVDNRTASFVLTDTKSGCLQTYIVDHDATVSTTRKSPGFLQALQMPLHYTAHLLPRPILPPQHHLSRQQMQNQESGNERFCIGEQCPETLFNCLDHSNHSIRKLNRNQIRPRDHNGSSRRPHRRRPSKGLGSHRHGRVAHHKRRCDG